MNKAATYIWFGLALAFVAARLARPALFSPTSIAGSLGAFGAWTFLVYALLSCFRFAALVPSTPLILAGVILFPGALWSVLAISMLGVVCAGLFVYTFPRQAGHHERFEERYPKQIAWLRDHLSRRRGLWFMAGWAFLPVAPTDLGCYVAGLVGMPLRRMILGLVIGELPVVAAYTFLGSKLVAAL